MITSLLAATLSSIAGLVCPMSGETLSADSKAVDLNGVRYRFCCASCVAGFKKDPAGALKKASEKKWLVGVSVFDVVSGRKLTPQNAKGGFSDYEGTRFYFQNMMNKQAFDAGPQKFGAIPDKASTICPVMGVELTNTYSAPGFADFEGVRYFACCETCLPQLRANPGRFAASAAGKVGAPKAYDVPEAWLKLTGPG
jgi:YHS domain-containing protein